MLEYMKIAFLTSSISRMGGGLYDSIRFLSQSIYELKNIEIEILGINDQYTSKDIKGWGSVPVSVFNTWGPKSIGYAPNLTKSLTDRKLDLVHSHGIWTYQSYACLSWWEKKKKPYLISVHGMLDRWAIKRSQYKKLFAKAIYQNKHLHNAACLHALCESEVNAIRDYGLKNPICVIPNGITVPKIKSGNIPPWKEKNPKKYKNNYFI